MNYKASNVQSQNHIFTDEDLGVKMKRQQAQKGVVSRTTAPAKWPVSNVNVARWHLLLSGRGCKGLEGLMLKVRCKSADWKFT